MTADLAPSGPDSDVHELEALGRKFHVDVAASVPDDMLDPELVASLPVEWARAHAMLPVP